MNVTVPAGCATSAAAGALCATVLLFTLMVAMGAGPLCALPHATRPAAIIANMAPFFICILLSLVRQNEQIKHKENYSVHSV
jgi:hypothetical protein